MNTKYQGLENHFVNLMKKLEPILTSSEISEVSEFIDYNEYGLALDTIVGIIVEEGKIIDNNILKQMIEISIIMDVDSEIIGEKLSMHII